MGPADTWIPYFTVGSFFTAGSLGRGAQPVKTSRDIAAAIAKVCLTARSAPSRSRFRLDPEPRASASGHGRRSSWALMSYAPLYGCLYGARYSRLRSFAAAGLPTMRFEAMSHSTRVPVWYEIIASC